MLGRGAGGPVNGFNSASRRRGVPGLGHQHEPQGWRSLASPTQGTSQGTEGLPLTSLHCFPSAVPSETLTRGFSRWTQSPLAPQAQPLRGPVGWVSESWEEVAGGKQGAAPGSNAVPSGRLCSVSFPLPGPSALHSRSSDPLMPWLCSLHVASHDHPRNS